MNIIEKLKAGKSNFKLVTFPGTDIKVEMRVLSHSEIQQAELETIKYFEGQDIKCNETTIDLYDSEKVIRKLFKSLTFNSQSIGTLDEFKSVLTPEVYDYLDEQLDSLHEECSPDLTKLSDERAKELIEAVKKKPDQVWMDLDIHTLRKLTIFMANQL